MCTGYHCFEVWGKVVEPIRVLRPEVFDSLMKSLHKVDGFYYVSIQGLRGSAENLVGLLPSGDVRLR
jgi:hypothetical protein